MTIKQLDRLMIVIGGIFAFIFLPYLVGSMKIFGAGSNILLTWFTGFLIIVVFCIVIMMLGVLVFNLWNYIKDGK